MRFALRRPISSNTILLACVLLSCSETKNQGQREAALDSLGLNRGEITLCGSGLDQFGTVSFGISCAGKVREDFNVATALLHSFEYTEAEKIFAKVIEQDPQCIFAYWGAAMCNFHPMWEPPRKADLQKGSRIIRLARSLIQDTVTRESDYIEAIAAIYDQWETLDYHTRVVKFEKACGRIFEKYPGDNEAGIFYALALVASADPTDKSFRNQKKAGEILNSIFVRQPNHPGIAHYIIHTFDYPELAELALPTARQYSKIAPASAHAQHMPSHIFIRLGLWEESILSNLNSISAAQCYAKTMNRSGHWDEELHGMDYAVYGYLQQGNDDKALEQVKYLNDIRTVFPQNFKDAYAFAAIPARYALERKDWDAAMKLELKPSDFPWEKFPWERANINFARLLGAVHANKLDDAKKELKNLEQIHEQLLAARDSYKANLVLVQVKSSQAWIMQGEGRNAEAITVMTEAASMEDATAKHPVTPGEIIPARELLADMYLSLNEPAKALEAYEADLKTHPNRFHGLSGAGRAAEKLNDRRKALRYYTQLLTMSSSGSKRPERSVAQLFVNN